MKEKIKTMRVDITLSALLSIIVGALLIFCPLELTVIFARIIAVILMLSGSVFCVTKFLEPMRSVFSIVVGGVIILIGLWIFVSPTGVVQIVPIAIGVLLVVHGIQDISMAFELKKNRGDCWWISLIVAALNILFGVLCICNAFGLFKLMLFFVGLMLIYDGISDIFIVHKVKKAEKNIVDSDIIREETINDDDFGF